MVYVPDESEEEVSDYVNILPVKAGDKLVGRDTDPFSLAFPDGMGVFAEMPWRWKLWLLNAAAVVYFVALSLGSLVIGLLVTLPELYRDNPAHLHTCRVSACWVFTVLLLNYTCLRYYSRHSRVTSDNWGSLPRTNPLQETRVCQSCEILSPPRAKHCPLCGVCVLKRDHHCFFGGCCVGFHNQRYFIVFCLYGSLGALYSTCATFAYLRIHYGDVLSSQFYLFFMPWVIWYWWLGNIHLNIVAMVAFSYFCVLTLLACLYFFLFQCFLLWRGQTSYEYVKGIRRYRCSLGRNLRSVFGPLWFLNFVVPLPCLRSPDDGYEWGISHSFKQM